MIKYDSEEHYRFHNVKVPDENIGKMMVYFKRIPQGEQLHSSDNLYTALNNFIKFPQTQHKPSEKSSQKMDQGEVPKNRTLIAVNFDHPFDRKRMDKIFSLCGRLRRVFVGSVKVQEENKKRTVHVAMIVFKNEFDLTKCFNIEYFQHRISQKFQNINTLSISDYNQSLLKHYEVSDPEKDKIIQEAKQDGFQVVTNRSGNFTLNLEKPVFEKQNWVGRNKKKPKKDAVRSEEVEAVIEGMDGLLPKQKKQDILKIQKRELLKQFEEDKRKIQKKVKSD